MARSRHRHEEPRVYRLPGGGKRRNLAALLAHFGPTHGLTYQSFHGFQYKTGWPGLNGKRLDVVQEKPPSPSKAPRENTYFDSQVEQALQRPMMDNDGEVYLHGQRRYTIERSKKELGNPSFNLWMRWRRRCDVINGKGIRVYKSIPGVFPLKTCSSEQIDQVKTALADAGAGRFVYRFHGRDEVWISWAIAGQYLTFGSRLLVRRTYLYDRWRKKGCPYLDGQKLKIRRFDFSKENWFYEGHIARISVALVTKEMRGRGIEGSETEAMPTSDSRSRRPSPIVTFSGIFEESDGKRYTIQAASQKSGISEVTLYEYLRKIPPGSPLDGLFPRDQLPKEKRLIPGTKRMRLPTIHERDLDIIEKTWHAEYDEAERIAGLPREKSANQICDLHGISRPGDRIHVHNLLVAALPGVPAKRAARGPRGYTPTVLYNLDHLETLLNGRDLLEVAKNHAVDHRRKKGG